MAAHGYERATRDVDIVYSTEPASCTAFAEVLGDLRAEVALADEAVGSTEIDAEMLRRGGHFRFSTEAGPLDALSKISGFDFPALARDAIEAELGDFSLLICSLDSLTAMKESTDRPRDQEDLKALREVNEGR